MQAGHHDNGSGMTGSSNGTVAPSARPKRVAVPLAAEEKSASGLSLSTGHELESQLREMEAEVVMIHPAMGEIFASHTLRVRQVLAAALEGALRSERRRLTWLLHNDLAGVLAVAREKLAAAADVGDDVARRDVLRDVEQCLASAAKATRGLISDLETPPAAESK